MIENYLINNFFSGDVFMLKTENKKFRFKKNVIIFTLTLFVVTGIFIQSQAEESRANQNANLSNTNYFKLEESKCVDYFMPIDGDSDEVIIPELCKKKNAFVSCARVFGGKSCTCCLNDSLNE